MFDFIRKPMLWEVWDAGIDKKINKSSGFHLKTIQDVIVYNFIKDKSGLSIAEVGGGDSRLLNALCQTNTCANIEKFEGADGGPGNVIEIPGVKNYLAFLGEFNETLPDNHFDIVFSVSVIEHVPTEKLENFLKDGLRIMKPGALFIHAIDLYVENEPTEYWISRYESYRKWLSPGSGLEPTGQVFEGPLCFSCDMATNPDNTMYSWGKISPQLIDLRKMAQSVSLLVAGRKAG